MLIFGLKEKWQAFYKFKNREHHWLRILGYVIRGVRLLAAPWRASSHSIWHLKVCHKGSVALFRVFCYFFWVGLSLLVPLVRPGSSWRMGWSPSLPPRSREGMASPASALE